MKFIYFILLFIISSSSIAQENKVLIGFETSIGLGGLRGNPLFENENELKKVFNNGISIQYNLNNTIALSSGLYFQNKGTIIPFVTIGDINGTTIGEVRGNENFNFINLPILVRLNYGSKLKLIIDVGPYLGILVNQTEKTSAQEKFEKNNTNLYKKVEFGMHTGIGCLVNAGKRFFIMFKINNEFGISDLGKNPNYSNLPIQTARFKDVQIYKSGSVKTNTSYFRIGLLHTFK